MARNRVSLPIARALEQVAVPHRRRCVGHGMPGFDSDIDLLVVAEPLPRGRMARVREFDSVESTLEPRIWSLEKLGILTSLSPMPRSQLPPRRSRKVTFRSQPSGPSGSTLPSTSI